MIDLAALDVTETNTETGRKRSFALRLHDKAPWALVLAALYLYDPLAWHLAVSVLLNRLAGLGP